MEEKAKRKVIYKPPEALFPDTNNFCPGCQHGVITRLVAEVIEELGIQGECIGVGGVGCHAMAANIINVDFIHALHGRAPCVGTGLKRGHYGKKVVFTFQGDGDLAAIGMGDIINAVNRGEKLTTIFFNNAGYGTTGGQMAPTTVYGQVTTTTPLGRDRETEGTPAHIAELMASLGGVAYSARFSLLSVKDYVKAKKGVKEAFMKQIDNVGYGFAELLSASPACWSKSPGDAIEWLKENMLKEYPLGVFKDVKAGEDQVKQL
jgi:2-oxoglutarate ferredoxin oxidoreductase subunit beta